MWRFSQSPHVFLQAYYSTSLAYFFIASNVNNELVAVGCLPNV